MIRELHNIYKIKKLCHCFILNCNKFFYVCRQKDFSCILEKITSQDIDKCKKVLNYSIGVHVFTSYISY